MKNKQFIFLFIYVLCSLFCINIAAQHINVRPDMNLVGYVSDGEKGIQGIAVSDGYNVVLTDQNGIYQMKRNEKAKFVFISVPAEYKLPVAGSIPAFYKPIDHDIEVTYANFQLERGKIENEFVLVTMADPQPSKDWEVARFRNETIKDINGLVGQYPSSTVFFGLAVGDLTWDAPDLYPGYINAVNQLPFAVLPVIGNHDHDQHVKGDDYKASHNYEKYLGPTYYSYNKGQCHFVVLDDIKYNTRKEYENYITEEQLAWLKEDLKYVGKDKLIIIGVHAPTKNYDKGVKNREDLYDLLNGYKTIIMSGHTHTGKYTEIRDNIVEYNLSAVFGSGWSGDIGQVGEPNGYAVFEFKGSELKNQYYKGTGLPSGFQMKLYPLDSWQSHKNHVIANIWNYNEHWTLEVYENGKLQNKGLTRYSDYDPFAYDFYFGPDKPKHRPRTEPKISRNLFYYKPNNKKSTVKIVAKDRFGNEYTEQIELK